MTTWGGLNPSFCTYELDKETLLPVNRQTWSFDIESSNQLDQPDWNLYTDWTKDYSMTDLSPSSYLDLANRLVYDTKLASDFSRRMGRHL